MTVGAVGNFGTYGYTYPTRMTSLAKMVQPVEPVKAITEMPTFDGEQTTQVVSNPSAQQKAQPESVENMLARYDSDYAGMAVRQRIQFVGEAGTGAAQVTEPASGAGEETKSAAEVMEEGECQTCAQRKYQDGSDDPGVSFKTPGHIDPESAASVVRSHEQEHVTREQAKAEREDREVVQQSVTLHNDICPECGKVYVSGGTTRTTTAADNSEELANSRQEQQERTPFAAVA